MQKKLEEFASGIVLIIGIDSAIAGKLPPVLLVLIYFSTGAFERPSKITVIASLIAVLLVDLIWSYWNPFA